MANWNRPPNAVSGDVSPLRLALQPDGLGDGVGDGVGVGAGAGEGAGDGLVGVDVELSLPLPPLHAQTMTASANGVSAVRSRLISV